MKDLRRLLSFLQPFRAWVLLSTALGVATVVSNIALLGTSAYLIASAALHPSIADLQVAIVGVRFFGIARGIFRYLERLSSHSVNFRLLARLRVWFYNAIEPLAPAGLVHRQSGDLLNRAMGDVETLENFYVRAVSPVIVAAIVTLGMGWYVGRLSPALGMVLLLGMLLSGVLVPVLSERINHLAGQRWVQAREQLSATLVDTIQGQSDLTAFNAEQAALDRLQFASLSGIRAQRRMVWSGAGLSALNQVFMHLTLWVILLTAVPLVSSGHLEGVLLAVLVVITLASFEAVTPLAQAAQFWQSSRSAAGNLFEIADTPRPVAESECALPMPAGSRIRARGLALQYAEGDEEALAGLNLDLQAGRWVAVVGPSGAGKTSLANLLLKFWGTAPGMLQWEDVDFCQLSAEAVRARSCLIAQKPYFFNASLRQNLLLAKPGASDAELLQVLQAVAMGAWAAGLPDGLDTWLGERGYRLSGGERQRLAIARALLQEDASLVILDEPTANLDAVTERQILDLLRIAFKDRGVVWITHRLVQLERVDEIIVLDHGRVVERGSQASLMEARGLFWKMKQTQDRLLDQDWLDAG